MEHSVAGGVRIAYQEAGQGDPAVVVIHGPIGSRPQLAGLIEHLAKSHRVVAPDLRGTGESDKPEHGYAMADLAQDVLAVCRAAGVRRTVLVGHSLGAAVALEIAAREPDLVAGVVMLDGAILYPDALRRQLLEGPIPALEGAGWMEALRGYVAAKMFDPADPAEVRSQVLEGLAALPPRLAGEVMRDGLGRDYSDLISKGTYPLLFVHARVPADVARLKQLRPDATVTTVVGSSHFMTMIVPDQVNAIVDDFLAVVTGASQTSDGRTARR